MTDWINLKTKHVWENSAVAVRALKYGSSIIEGTKLVVIRGIEAHDAHDKSQLFRITVIRDTVAHQIRLVPKPS